MLRAGWVASPLKVCGAKVSEISRDPMLTTPPEEPFMAAAAMAVPLALKLVLVKIYGEARAATSKIPPAEMEIDVELLMEPEPLRDAAGHAYGHRSGPAGLFPR